MGGLWHWFTHIYLSQVVSSHKFLSPNMGWEPSSCAGIPQGSKGTCKWLVMAMVDKYQNWLNPLICCWKRNHWNIDSLLTKLQFLLNLPMILTYQIQILLVKCHEETWSMFGSPQKQHMFYRLWFYLMWFPITKKKHYRISRYPHPRLTMEMPSFAGHLHPSAPEAVIGDPLHEAALHLSVGVPTWAAGVGAGDCWRW